jgi:hypothetical protein
MLVVSNGTVTEQESLTISLPHFVSHFKQHASGEFDATVVPGTNHCGIDDANGHFRFEVDIDFHGSRDPLDDHGFLFDNTDFGRYFSSLPPISVSCERLAEQSAHAFLGMLGDRARCVKSICVKIFPFGDVCVEEDLEIE